ncbi:uncharacterized protein [Drosophila virilis]|uniref:Uncharacterized protein n=1 Tax=Drosophila virilis TaxID=7244 RepID=B4M528_DROVI|nr:uncharacterized protein LOC6632391 [Drosophila virilis]EDW59739.1 uncharacterized protein Dvir_GJ10119 [Drosophila virilis]
MSGTLLSVLLFIVISAPTLHAQIRCMIPVPGKMPKGQKRDLDSDVSERFGASSLETLDIEADADKSSHEGTDKYNENELNFNEDGRAIKPGNGKVTTKKPPPYRIKKPYRQSTLMRNPNYKRVNRKLDRIAQRMFMLELPLPHPGAQAGSSNGCDQSTSKPTAKFIKVKS